VATSSMSSTFTTTKSTAINKISKTFTSYRTRSTQLTLPQLARAIMIGLTHITTLVTRRRNFTQPPTIPQLRTFGTQTLTLPTECLILSTATVPEPRNAQKNLLETAATWRRRTNKGRVHALERR